MDEDSFEQKQQQEQRLQEQQQQQLDNTKKKAKVEPAQKVPQRPYGGTLVKNKNCRLPATVPIIGLGCSSFSTFFWPTSTDDGGNAAGNAAGTGAGDDRSSVDERQQLLKQEFTPETIERNHPIVETWIQTIKGTSKIDFLLFVFSQEGEFF